MPETKTQKAVVPDRERIPLVAHVITDDDMGMLQGDTLDPVNFNRIIKLLTDPHSVMLYDRHVCALKRLIKHFKHGFLIKDLVQIFKILNVCADRVESQPLYEEPIIELLKICSLPYLMEKASDGMVYEQIIVESVSQLGYLMRVPSSDIRRQICDTLMHFYSEAPCSGKMQKHRPTDLKFNKEIIECSDVSETLVKSLALIENDQEIKIVVLRVLQLFASNSSKNCDQMLRADCAEKICSHLMDPDPSGQILFRSVEILWNLLENGDKVQLSQQLNNVVCIRYEPMASSGDAFIFQLTQGYSHYDRQLRNDLLVIATLVASNNRRAVFLETGFIHQLVLFATFQEVKSHHALVKHLKLLTNHEDFELKKLLFNILVVLSNDPCVITNLSEGHLLLALFSFVRANEKQTGPRDWTVAQFEELQLHAMSCLCTLCPLMLEDYMTCQGSTRLLLLLEWCVGPDGYFGQGNCFHGTGGRGNKRAQMRHCLRLMRSIVSTEDEVVIQDLADQGAINQLIGILTTAFTDDLEKEDAVGIEMQTDILFILACLCENDLHRKELFGTQGINMIVKYLKMNSKLLNSGLGHHRLLLASIDCVWCAIVSCYTTEDYFLEKEGAFLLLDQLEVCPRSMHNMMLGCLLDLCENPKTFNHMLSWRSKAQETAAHMFCEMWRQEEARIGAKRDALGTITDPHCPLMGKVQQDLPIMPLPAKSPTQAVLEISENMRAKIYSLFCKMGFTDLAGLTVDDHVTLTLIEKYMDFKMGEVWSDVIQELEVEDLRPVTPDQEAVEAISRAIEERAQIVQSTQVELMEAQRNQDNLDEQEFYAEIRENHRQKDKQIVDFNDFVARTSSYSMLKAAKKRMDMSIDASRVDVKVMQTLAFHPTDVPNLQTTTFSGRHVAVVSTPAIQDDQPLKTVDPSVISVHPPPSQRLIKHLTM